MCDVNPNLVHVLQIVIKIFACELFFRKILPTLFSFSNFFIYVKRQPWTVRHVYQGYFSQPLPDRLKSRADHHVLRTAMFFHGGAMYFSWIEVPCFICFTWHCHVLLIDAPCIFHAGATFYTWQEHDGAIFNILLLFKKSTVQAVTGKLY